MSKRIGIFAGTFDPIHEGHLAFARLALDHGLEKVMFLPEPTPRRKQGVRALEHRIAMVRLAIEQESRWGVIILEQARFTPNETLPPLRARFPDHKLVLMFGDDVVDYIANWPHIDALVNDVELLIASRHKDSEVVKAKLQTLQQTRDLSFTHQIVYPGRETITSSKVRLALKHDRKVEGLPQSVRDYIRQRNLYSEAESSES